MQDFPEENIKIVFFEDFEKDKNAFFQDLFDFLEVDNFQIEGLEQVYNASKGKWAETGLTRTLRKFLGFNFLRDILPNNIRALGRKTLKQEVVERPK